jgi:hypothetical protein
MIAIIDLHPLRKIISAMIQRAHIAPIPIDIDEIMVNARGGV